MEDHMNIWFNLRLFVYFVAIWYIFPVLVCCTKKNLATLNKTVSSRGVNTNCRFLL
jgi:hypothetical protein